MLEKLKVLFVEDEPEIRFSLQRLLQRRVGEISVAENGVEGFSSFLEDQPDVVVTDIEMPGMNGVEMIRHIREVNSDVPIVVVSAYIDRHEVIGANRVLPKPVLIRDLMQAITELAGA